jgi:lipoprotein-anchoring transpeptidase ErfK/SrfK
VLEKDPEHHSNLYGNFVDGIGRIVRSGVSSKLDAAPSGTHFSGAPMKFFMRLTPQGVGMHVGILPGYPASHGCIRLPQEMARIIYTAVGINTPVIVTD